MNSKLPKVFVNPIKGNINNNQDVTSISEESSINLDDIFDSSKYLFKHRYLITLKSGEVITSSIISRRGNKLLTIDNDILDEDFIKNTHKILKTNTSDSRISWFNVGEYKSRKNMVGDLITTPPEKVKSTIEKLLNEYNKKQTVSFDDILDFHVKFERIHPFQDGNGRVGRIIMFKECLKYNIVPFIIEDNLKMYYYRGLKEWDNEKGYLRDTCLTAQDRYKQYLDYFEIKY